jgi:transposase
MGRRTRVRRTFSREFKFKAVKLVRDRGTTVAKASRDLDVHENVQWTRSEPPVRRP